MITRAILKRAMKGNGAILLSIQYIPELKTCNIRLCHVRHGTKLWGALNEAFDSDHTHADRVHAPLGIISIAPLLTPAAVRELQAHPHYTKS